MTQACIGASPLAVWISVGALVGIAIACLGWVGVWVSYAWRDRR